MPQYLLALTSLHIVEVRDHAFKNLDACHIEAHTVVDIPLEHGDMLLVELNQLLVLLLRYVLEEHCVSRSGGIEEVAITAQCRSMATYGNHVVDVMYCIASSAMHAIEDCMACNGCPICQ